MVVHVFLMQLGADYVTMIIERVDSCGLGYVIKNPALSGTDAYAFSGEPPLLVIHAEQHSAVSTNLDALKILGSHSSLQFGWLPSVSNTCCLVLISHGPLATLMGKATCLQLLPPSGLTVLKRVLHAR